MKDSFLRGLLRDRAGEPEGGGEPAPKIDPGAPFVHGDEPAQPKQEAKPAEKSEADKQLAALQKEITDRDKRISELSDSERYWSEQARAAKAPKEEPEPERKRREPNAAEDEKPEKFLDDLTVGGLRALKAKGVITADEFDERLEAMEQRIEDRLTQQAQHTKIDQQLAEFPELKDPKSPLFERAQQHFRQMVEDDPAMKNTPAALLSSVRMAKKELDLEAKVTDTTTNDKRETRRERVERQMPERSTRSNHEEEGDRDPLSPKAREVVNALSRFGANEEGFRKFANGRVR